VSGSHHLHTTIDFSKPIAIVQQAEHFLSTRHRASKACRHLRTATTAARALMPAGVAAQDRVASVDDGTPHVAPRRPRPHASLQSIPATTDPAHNTLSLVVRGHGGEGEEHVGRMHKQQADGAPLLGPLQQRSLYLQVCLILGLLFDGHL
jgi:hypothetical protein